MSWQMSWSSSSSSWTNLLSSGSIASGYMFAMNARSYSLTMDYYYMGTHYWFESSAMSASQSYSVSISMSSSRLYMYIDGVLQNPGGLAVTAYSGADTQVAFCDAEVPYSSGTMATGCSDVMISRLDYGALASPPPAAPSPPPFPPPFPPAPSPPPFPPPFPPSCVDVWPTHYERNCAWALSQGKCVDPWWQTQCLETCGACPTPSCPDAWPSQYERNCAWARHEGNCAHPWWSSMCQGTCGVC